MSKKNVGVVGSDESNVSGPLQFVILSKEVNNWKKLQEELNVYGKEYKIVGVVPFVSTVTEFATESVLCFLEKK